MSWPWNGWPRSPGRPADARRSRSHGARRSFASWPVASGDADDRRVEGDHGPAGVHRRRGAGGRRPLAQFRGPNIPAAHPARDPLENFYLAGGGERRRGFRGQAADRHRDASHSPSPAPSAEPNEHRADSGDGEERSRRCGSSRAAGSIGPTRPMPRTTRCSTRSRACWSIAA